MLIHTHTKKHTQLALQKKSLLNMDTVEDINEVLLILETHKSTI